MNLIFVIVCAIALFLFFGCVNSHRPPEITANNAAINDTGRRRDQIISRSNFTRDLLQQYEKLYATIMDVWQKCNLTNPAMYSEAIVVFVSTPGSDDLTFSKAGKCNVDCTLRGTGLMTDVGFQDAKYLEIIRQLRLNYTSHDINVMNDNNELMTFDSIERLIVGNFDGSDRDKCFTMKESENPDISLRPDVCYRLIQSYEQAANHCKDLKDPHGDSCETAYMIVRCVTNEQRGRSLIGPFYPISIRVPRESHG